MMRLAAFVLILGPLQGSICQEYPSPEVKSKEGTNGSGFLIQVFQAPVIFATLGSNATLPCTYNISGGEDMTGGSYKWYRHLVKTGLEVSDTNKDFSSRISRVDRDEFVRTRLAHITIHNVDPTDTAFYYCEVTFLESAEISEHGAGTLLNVTGFPIQVFQAPVIFATPGSDATLPCTYNISGEVEMTIGSYMWYRHLVEFGQEVSDTNKDFAGRISRVDRDKFIRTRLAHITIHNVNLTDEGTYYCEVSLLAGGAISGHGAGTLLNVTDVVESPLPYSLHISRHAVSGVVVVGLLLIIAGCCRGHKCCAQRTGSRQNGARGPEMLQNVETPDYMMENQQSNLFLPEQVMKKPGALQPSGDKCVVPCHRGDSFPTEPVMSLKVGPPPIRRWITMA